MNRGKIFRSRFNRRMHGLQDSASHFQSAVHDQAASLVDQTREGLARGQKMMGRWEKSMKDSVRDNPMFFLGAAVATLAVTGLLVMGLMMKRK